MRLKRFFIIAIITPLLTVLQPWRHNFSALFATPQALAQTPDARKAAAYRLFKQGIEQFQTSQYEAALDSWHQALILFQKLENRLGEGKSLGNLGMVYRVLGYYDTAIKYHQQSLAIAQEIKNYPGQSASLVNLGNAYLYLGDYGKAIKYYQQSLAIAQEINDPQGEGQARKNLGTVYLYLGNYGTAIDYFQQSLAIVQKINAPQGEAQALNGLGEAYGALGDHDGAIKYHLQSLAIARKIRDPLGQGQSLGSLGNAYDDLGDYGKAIYYHQQSFAIARKIRDTIGEGQSLNNLGVALLQSGSLLEAEKTLRDGVKVWESIREVSGNDDNKVSIFEVQARTYRWLQQVLVAQNKTDAALEIAERGRARAFVELLARRLLPDSAAQRTDAANPASTNPPTIQQIQQIAKTQNATLVQYSIITNNFKVQGKQLSQESELYIWVVKPTGEVSFRKSDLRPLWQQQNISLADLVTNTRESIGVSRSIFITEVVNPVEEESQNKRLQQLHQLLIKPITDLLPTNPNERVIFVPQRELFLVPFAALEDSNGKYLIEKHTILTSPSIQVLQLTRQAREKVKQAAVSDALVLGNPTMPSVPPKIGEKPQPLPSLPGAKGEALAIAQLLSTKALTGDEATIAAVLARLPQARIVHLATHGLLDDFQGLQSAIALAPTNTDNGLLTAEEILKQKLNAELVVLSACDTARGRITGDGVIGLSRSLFIAGTPSVIVSLWSVPDAPTAELMTEFYRQLKQTGDKAQSLRQAMLKLKEQYPNTPKKWAAFTLIGEAE